MKFLYQAKDKAGELKKGYVVAATQAKAEQLLSESGFIIIGLSVQKESLLERLNFLSRRVSYKDLVIFARQMATLVAAKVPILQGLRILEAQLSSKALINITKSLITSVEGGESLSLALSKHPQVFGNIFVSLVRSGEASGTVAQALTSLADQMEKDYDLRRKVRGALTYPGFVVSALIIVGVLMFKFVLPNLVSVLKEQQVALPPLSQALISFTDFFQVYWWLVILGFAVLVVSFRYFIRTDSGRYIWDKYKVKIPIIGTMLQKIYLARFARNLSTLVAGGIPIIQALKIVSEVVNNLIYRDIIIEAASSVTKGKSISDALAEHREFPPLATQMIRVGEQTAELDAILINLASFYEKEVDASVGSLSSLLEPMIMLILGVAVGLLVVGVLLPIYNMAGTQ